MTIVDFWDRADRSGGPDACWPWQGVRRPHGYGQFGRNGHAHRHAYELAVESIPPGLVVMHTCDNPPCINPAHLRLGTLMDNWDDMRAKQRHYVPTARRGSENQNAKLTEDDVRLIRQSSDSAPTLARRLRVGNTAIRNVRRGATWAHVR